MDNGELDFPSEQMLSCFDIPNSPGSCLFDIDEFLARPQSCTHAHACNPSGPDKSHTHTCIHVHTQVMPTPSGDDTGDSSEKKGQKRPFGNREAVRKYREKKKARNASLEDEVVRLRALNQQLMKRLQGQASLEAEVARLKCLLVDIRGRVEGEIGSFPYQKPLKVGDVYQQNIANNVNNIPSSYVMNPCNVQSNDCGLNSQGLSDCGFDNLQCLGNQNFELPDCGLDSANGVSARNTSSTSKRKRWLH